MGVRMKSPKSLLGTSLHLVLILLSEVILHASAGPSGHNSVLGSPKYNSASTKEALQRRLLKGREVIPPGISSNAIPGEPSCEELRAMWRYYKRQSRAEDTNEIPRFGSNPFWDILPGSPPQPRISSFGPLKGRSKARLRLKNGKGPNVYGRVVYKEEKDRARKPRPIQQVSQMMGKSKAEGEVGARSKEPIVHLSPPPTPTKASSLQKIKEVFREERIREKDPGMRNNDDNSKAFGRIILSPPRGMDGRVANKPRELMTPFEQIRFGHADNILDDGSKPNLNFMAKRRTLPLPMLKLRLQHSRQSRRHPFAPSDLSVDQPVIWTSRMGQDYDQNLSPPESSQINVEETKDLGDNEYQIDGNEWLTFNTESRDAKPEMEYSSGGVGERYQNSQSLPTLVDPNSRNPLLPLSMPTCSEMEGQPCQMNSDCSCVGFGLYRCYVNQCQMLSLLPPSRGSEDANTDEPAASLSSFWHSSPLEPDELGVWEVTPGGDGGGGGRNGGDGGDGGLPISIYEYPASPSDNNNFEAEKRSQPAVGVSGSKSSREETKLPE